MFSSVTRNAANGKIGKYDRNVLVELFSALNLPKNTGASAELMAAEN